MAWVTVDKNGIEEVFSYKPHRDEDIWTDYEDEFEDDTDSGIILPEGSIKKLINIDMTWIDDPILLE